MISGLKIAMSGLKLLAPLVCIGPRRHISDIFALPMLCSPQFFQLAQTSWKELPCISFWSVFSSPIVYCDVMLLYICIFWWYRLWLPGRKAGSVSVSSDNLASSHHLCLTIFCNGNFKSWIITLLFLKPNQIISWVQIHHQELPRELVCRTNQT